ncbi:MAG: aminotransferase class I/II-fold pyridoxal phosphate-dependent enzyme [Bacilli bacterium]
MLAFCNDYSEGCHPLILKRLVETNMEELPGYGSDHYTLEAKKKIAAACHAPNAEVYLLAGGTQSNQVVIASLLRSYEGVISCSSGHIAVHEAGAIEETGHKVLTIPAKEGKLMADDLEKYLLDFDHAASKEHMVQPGMVYISQPTEYGTLYSKAELRALHEVAHHYGLPLFVDGARLAYALATKENDVSLAELAQLSEVFYFGGTKAGLLCGEAVVFPQGAPKHFLTFIKQHGALMAKGRLLGVQFDALFTDNLYLKIGKNAIGQALRLRAALKEKGYRFAVASPTNQTFVVVDNKKKEELAKKVWFDLWDNLDAGHTVIRFCMSWATSKEAVDELIATL